MTSQPETSSSALAVARDDGEIESGEIAPGNRGSVVSKEPATSGVSSDLLCFQQFMRQGSWRAISDKVQEVRRLSLVLGLDEQFAYTTYYVLALMKLRIYDAAEKELSALGDLNSQEYRFENLPHVYPGKSGSMVPFGLRWLHAELPHRIEQTSATIDRLYDLLAHCNEQIDFLHASVDHTAGSAAEVSMQTTSLPGGHAGTSSSPPEDATSRPMGESSTGKPVVPEKGVHVKLEHVGRDGLPSEALQDDDFGEFVASTVDSGSSGNVVYTTLVDRWRRRYEVVLCSILCHHLNQKDYIICLNWLENLLKKRPHDALLLSKYGYVQLQLGDLYGARNTFARVEAIYEQRGKLPTPVLGSLLSRNRGLLYFSLKQYVRAVDEFNLVLNSDPSDVVSANNKALCLMYSRDLPGATGVLESLLQTCPVTGLNEALVLNLCSMYELASMNSVETKKALSSWIHHIAPDDFDVTCTRL